MSNDINLTIEDAAGTTSEHTVAPRPFDQFGYLKWAGPALGVDSIQDDPMAFALYGAIRALRRTGHLDTGEDMAAQMQRVVSMDYTDADSEPGAAVDPTTPAP